MFYNKVYSRFGLYDKIISDQGPQFASLFAKELGRPLGYTLSLSTAYHPQTDGETKHVNQELKTYLHIFCQNDLFSWSDHLPTAEFTYNHWPHSVTETSSFYLMYEHKPRPLPTIISKTHIPAVESWIKELSEAGNKANTTHDLAWKAMKDQNSGKFLPFSKGDKVWLEAHNLKCLYENHKSTLKCEDPFLISKVLSPVMYCLAIPSKWKIHNMFHASLLSPYCKNDIHGLNYTRPTPDLVQGEEEYKVKAILSHQGSAQNRSYLMHWKGYTTAEDLWKPEAHLKHAADILSAYKKAHSKAFPSRTNTHIVSIKHIFVEMAPTCPLPFAHCLCQPAHK